MTTIEIYNALRSEICPAAGCGREKDVGYSFCDACYRSLPVQVKMDLCCSVSRPPSLNGITKAYKSAYTRALAHLAALDAREQPRLFSPAVEEVLAERSMSGVMEQVRLAAATRLEEIKQLIKPDQHTKMTLVIHNTTMPEADIVITEDDFDAVIKILEDSKAREAAAAAKSV